MEFSYKPIFLLSDILIYFFVIAVITVMVRMLKKNYWRQAWLRILQRPVAIFSLIILTVYVVIGLMDSIHFVPRIHTAADKTAQYAVTSVSLLDRIMSPLSELTEVTYSAPFSTHLYVKEWVQMANGQYLNVYPKLQHAAIGINSTEERNIDVIKRLSVALLYAMLVNLFVYNLILWFYARKKQISILSVNREISRGKTQFPWRTAIITISLLNIAIISMLLLCHHYHIWGTTKVGSDVFYQVIKSIRTGLLIGSLTTLFSLPFAVLLGMLAGYRGGKVDDIIQYIYTTFSSIPSVLLIVAAVLSMQIYFSSHPELFVTITQRADLRLILLCAILGVTSWTGLCRIIRAETLKLREMDFVLAARTLGTKPYRILLDHILPNILHIIIISVVLDFSALVLAEAVLTYVGVGVDPSTLSWGNMIDTARLELARDPVVWWPLTAAFIFMFVLVLAINLFGDAVRAGFDPRQEVGD
jgi:peptide/nickel transport system permease protein